MSVRFPSIDPVDARWIARNPIYRRSRPVWELRAGYDRAAIMRDLAVLGPKPPRPAPEALRGPALSDSLDLPRLVRHLVIDGYDRPLRRWALARCRRGLNALYFAAGLLVAAVISSIASLAVTGGAATDAIKVLAGVNLGGAALAVVYALSRILPVVTASAYAGPWVRNMPRCRAAPRYWRMYDDPWPARPATADIGPRPSQT